MKRRSFLGVLAGLAVAPFLPKEKHQAKLVRDSFDQNPAILVFRDGPTTVFTIEDGGTIGIGTAAPDALMALT